MTHKWVRLLTSLFLSILLIVSVTACGSSSDPSAPDSAHTASSATDASDGTPSAPVSGDIDVYALDIGQGDAFLIKIGPSYTMIDTGDVKHRESIVHQLKALGVNEIDTIIITHPHADHLGGLYAILTTFKVKHVYDNGISIGSSVYRTYQKTAKRLGVPIDTLKDGQTIDFGHGASFTVYAPWADPVTDKKGKPDQNNNSIVGKLVFGKFSMLFTGDCSVTEENRLIKEYNTKLSSKILKVGHHGSDGSSQKDFIRSVRPEAAIISCGLYNSYGHPGQKTLQRLKDENVKIYRTDTMGTVHIHSDGKTYTISTER